MVYSGSFDVDHIASQLFWDVVQFNKSQLTRFTKDAKCMRFMGLEYDYGKAR